PLTMRGHGCFQQDAAADAIGRWRRRRGRLVRWMAREVLQGAEQLLLLYAALIEAALPPGGFAAEQIQLVIQRAERAFPLLDGAGEADCLLTQTIELTGRSRPLGGLRRGRPH